MNHAKSFVIAVIAFFVVMLITYVAKLQAGIELKENMTIETVIGVLTVFMLLTLVVERFADVVITGPREFDKMEIQERLDALKKSNADTTAVSKELREFRMDTLKQTVKLNLFLGLLLGLAGFRILTMVSGDVSQLQGAQQLIFHTVDIMLTAGLIAGGSKGINVISSSMKSWFSSNTPKQGGGQGNSSNP